MFEVSINGETVSADVTFFTAYIYEAEFCKDMIQDFFGVQTSEASIDMDGDTIATIDFTRTPWTATARALWAAIKTADEGAPGFKAWMKKTSGANFWILREQLGNEIADCFFRADAAGEEA